MIVSPVDLHLSWHCRTLFGFNHGFKHGRVIAPSSGRVRSPDVQFIEPIG